MTEENKEDEITINLDWFRRKKAEKPEGSESEHAPDTSEEISVEPIKRWVSENKTLARNIAVYGLLLLILVFAFNSRIQNIPNLNHTYLISPDDPYVFYRYANYIAEHGTLMQNDTMRYYPNGFDTKTENLFPAYLAGYALNIGKKVNPNINMFDVGAWFAPVLLIVALLAFFFLSKEIFKDDKIALIATGLLAFSQAILFRTAAGFLEKEPLFLPFMFLSLLFFIKGYKNEKRISYIYGAIAGVSTALAGFASGLFFFMQLYIFGFFAAEAVLSKLNKRKFLVYAIWFIVSSITLVALTTKYGRLDFYKSMQFQLPAIALVLGAVSVFLKKPAKLKIVPKGIFDVLIAVLIIFVLGLALLGPGTLMGQISYFVGRLQNPMGTERFTLSVSENQPPVFYSESGGGDWWHTFGLFFRNPINGQTMGIGLIFLLFFFGGIILFYKSFRQIRHVKYVTLIFFIFLCALVFEHFSNTYSTRWISILFSAQFIYIGLFFGSILVLLMVGEKFDSVDSAQLFLLVWFIISILGSNGAIRLFFILALPTSILAAYCIKELSNILARLKWGEFTRLLPYALAFVIIVASAFTATAASAGSWPGLADWYQAMDWVRANTSENAVFTHWWDYGYIVQAMGNRTTVVDPGNFDPAKDYDVGGRLFNAFNTSEVVSYLDTYHPTNWLINSEDVLKFYQIARLGSLYPTTTGRESYFSLYSSANIDYQKQTVTQNIVPNGISKIQNYSHLVVFESVSGQSQILQNFRVGNKMYDGEQTYLIRFLLPVKNESIGLPYAFIYDANTQSTDVLPVKCICTEKVGCKDVAGDESVPTCVMFTNHYLQGAGLVNIQYKARNVLFTQLYLLDRNITGFNKVYDNGIPLNMNSMRGERTQLRIYEFDYAALKANINSTGW